MNISIRWKIVQMSSNQRLDDVVIEQLIKNKVDTERADRAWRLGRSS